MPPRYKYPGGDEGPKASSRCAGVPQQPSDEAELIAAERAAAAEAEGRAASVARRGGAARCAGPDAVDGRNADAELNRSIRTPWCVPQCGAAPCGVFAQRDAVRFVCAGRRGVHAAGDVCGGRCCVCRFQTCVKCHQRLLSYANFCHYCGTQTLSPKP